MSILDDELTMVNDIISDTTIQPIVEKILAKCELDQSEKNILHSHVAVYKFDSNDSFRQFIRIVRDYDAYQELNLNWIDTSEVTTMDYLFRNSRFNGDISKWDVSGVHSMEQMFSGCYYFDRDISNWDTRNVRTMRYMFCDTKFNRDISNWDTGNVTDMESMFASSEFNRDISNWDTHNVRTMKNMFRKSSFNQDISKWDVSRVENMSGMFYESCFDGDISNWDVFNVTCVTEMFDKSLFSGDISKWEFGKILGDLHTVSDNVYKHGKCNYIEYINQQYVYEYDEMSLDGEYVLSKLLDVDCSDNFSIIENAHKIDDMLMILEMSTKLVKVKGVARLYNIPESFITHIVREDEQIKINNINDIYEVVNNYFKMYDDGSYRDCLYENYADNQIKYKIS